MAKYLITVLFAVLCLVGTAMAQDNQGVRPAGELTGSDASKTDETGRTVLKNERVWEGQKVECGGTDVWTTEPNENRDIVLVPPDGSRCVVRQYFQDNTSADTARAQAKMRFAEWVSDYCGHAFLGIHQFRDGALIRDASLIAFMNKVHPDGGDVSARGFVPGKGWWIDVPISAKIQKVQFEKYVNQLAMDMRKDKKKLKEVTAELEVYRDLLSASETFLESAEGELVKEKGKSDRLAAELKTLRAQAELKSIQYVQQISDQDEIAETPEDVRRLKEISELAGPVAQRRIDKILRDVYSKKQQYEELINTASRLIDDPMAGADWKVYTARGVALWKSRDRFADAELDFKKALELGPPEKDLHIVVNNLAVVLAKQQDMQKLKEALDLIDDFEHRRPLERDLFDTRAVIRSRWSQAMNCRDLQRACGLGNCANFKAAQSRGDCPRIDEEHATKIEE